MSDPKNRRAIIDAIETRIKTAAGVADANVLDQRYRWLNPEELLQAITTPDHGHVQAIFVRRRRTPQEDSQNARYVSIGHALARHYIFEIELFVGFEEAPYTTAAATDEASTEQFDCLIDNILAVFDNFKSASGTAWNVFPLQHNDSVMDSLGGVTCHKATFSIDVVEWVDGITPS